MAFCMYCGAQIQGEGAFCPICGKKQVTIYKQTFCRGKMTEQQFIDQINLWFAQYPQVANVKGKFSIKHGMGLLVNKYVLNEFSIEYEVLNGQNQNQYGVVALNTTGLIKTGTDALLAKWHQANPNAVVLNRDGGVNQRGSSSSLAFGGFGAVNNTQLYVFFKFNRKTGTGPVPQIQK